MKSKPGMSCVFLSKRVGEINYYADLVWVDFVTVFIFYWNLSFLIEQFL